MMNGSATVDLSDAELEEAARIAAYSVMHFDNSNVGSYGSNNIDSNVIGYKGKIGVAKWMRSFLSEAQMDQNFRASFTHLIDITSGPYAIAVKTLRPESWEKIGRMITTEQMPKFAKRGAIIIWALASASSVDPIVTLKGWNNSQYVQQHGILKDTKSPDPNVWLEDETKMRSMDVLRDYLRNAHPPQ